MGDDWLSVFIVVGSHVGEERAPLRDGRNAFDDDNGGGAKAQTAVNLVAAKEQHTAAAAATKR